MRMKYLQKRFVPFSAVGGAVRCPQGPVAMGHMGLRLSAAAGVPPNSVVDGREWLGRAFLYIFLSYPPLPLVHRLGLSTDIGSFLSLSRFIHLCCEKYTSSKFKQWDLVTSSPIVAIGSGGERNNPIPYMFFSPLLYSGSSAVPFGRRHVRPSADGLHGCLA